EASLAIIPGAWGTQPIPWFNRTGQSKRLIFTAKPIVAAEALQIGLVEQVVETNELLTSTVDLAKVIASNGPIALQQAKTSIDQGMQTDVTTGLAIEHLCYKETIPTDDRSEGLTAFEEKRKPEYQGK